MSKIIDRALDIINDRLKTQTSELSPTMEVRHGIPGMAHGGYVLEDDYPTHYLPDVGRQVMADGGMPAGRPDISQYLQQIQAQQAPMRQAPVVSDYAYTGAARPQGYEPNRPSWVAPGEYVQSFQGGSPTPYVYGQQQAAPTTRGQFDFGSILGMLFGGGRGFGRGYAEGGMPDDDPVARALQTAQSVSQEPMPDMTPRPTMPSAPSAEGRVTGQTIASRFGTIPEGAPWAQRAQTESTKPMTIKSMAKSFSDAIARHTSLPRDEMIQSSLDAQRRIAPYVGVVKDGSPVPLLGKNAKLMKTEAGYKGRKPIELDDGRGAETAGLALAPAFQYGSINTCPNHASCKDECLGKTSGNYFKLGGGSDLSDFKGPRLNSLNKTIAFFQDPEAFAIRLHDEIATAQANAAKNGNKLGVRLNVLSDIHPSIYKSIMEAFPDVQFYDYTKLNVDPVAENHHYTYSSTGISDGDVDNFHQNWKQMRSRLDRGDNVAMAFSHKQHLPEEVQDEETGKSYKVINGDTHDYRPLDKVPDGADGVIVGLKNKKAKGKQMEANKDSKGFFVKYDPELQRNEKGKLIRGESPGISEKTGKPMLGPTMPGNRQVVIGRQTKLSKKGEVN